MTLFPSRRHLTIAFVVGLGAVFLASLWLAWKFYFWEPKHVGRRSIAFVLKAPTVLRNHPAWQATTEPRFSFRSADGLKPSVASIGYESKLSTAAIKRRLQKLGFECEAGSASDTQLCQRDTDDGYTAQAFLRTLEQPTGSLVNIDFIRR